MVASPTLLCLFLYSLGGGIPPPPPPLKSGGGHESSKLFPRVYIYFSGATSKEDQKGDLPASGTPALASGKKRGYCGGTHGRRGRDT